MIIEYELVKREADHVTKQLIYDNLFIEDISNGKYMHYPDEVEKLCKDGYTVEHLRVVEELQHDKEGTVLYGERWHKI